MIAKIVLKQLFEQLGDSVLNYKKISELRGGDTLALKFAMYYRDLGEKEGTFVFNRENELLRMELFKMTIKTTNNQSEVIKSNEDMIRVPFRMINQLIAMDVLVNGEKRTFIFDSGSPRVILNSKYYIQKDENTRHITDSKGVNGYLSDMELLMIDELDWHGVKICGQELICLDLSHLEKELEQEFHGLIGYEMFKDYDLLFDYLNQELMLIKPEKFSDLSPRMFRRKNAVTVPFTMEAHIPVIKTSIGDKEYSFGIDSGAESVLIDSDLFQGLRTCLDSISDDRLIGADTNSVTVNIALLESMEIGSKTFKNLNTIFGSMDQMNKGYQIELHGLLGYPVLSKQLTMISFSRKEMVFYD